jgi:hypothetical protein
MRKAGSDAVFDDVHQQVVRTERGGDEIADVQMATSGFRGERRDIPIPVSAGPQEIRNDHYRRRTRCDARVERAADRRLREFHVRGLHDGIAESVSPVVYE